MFEPHCSVVVRVGPSSRSGRPAMVQQIPKWINGSSARTAIAAPNMYGTHPNEGMNSVHIAHIIGSSNWQLRDRKPPRRLRWQQPIH